MGNQTEFQLDKDYRYGHEAVTRSDGTHSNVKGCTN